MFKRLLFCSFLFSTLVASAQQKVVRADSMGFKNIGKYIEYFEDSTAQLTLQ